MHKEHLSEIEIIKEVGFSHVKWYDADLEYHYFDAKMNGTRVEVRTKNEQLEWRYFGIPLEEVEWFSIKHPQLAETEENTNFETKRVFEFPEKEEEPCMEPYIAYA
jgi:hypothetical protein